MKKEPSRSERIKPLDEKRKELLKRFPEVPLLDVMPLIKEQDEESIKNFLEEIKDRNHIDFIIQHKDGSIEFDADSYNKEVIDKLTIKHFRRGFLPK